MEQVINMDVIAELRSLSDDGDEQLLTELIHMFLADAPIKLNTITQGMKTGNLKDIEHAAHSLKGSSGNLGAVFVQNDCEAIQVASQRNEREKLGQMIDRLVADFNLAQSALQRLVSAS